MDNVSAVIAQLTSVNFISALLIILALAAAVFMIAKRAIPACAQKFISQIKPQWVGPCQEIQTFHHLTYIVPIVFLYFGAQYMSLYFDEEWGKEFLRLSSNILMCWVLVHMMLFANDLSDTILAIYEQYPIASIRSIKSFVQITMLLIYIIGFSSIVIILLHRDPSSIITTIGGGSIILGLIFRETIMSFTAGIQIISNNLIQKGDWVEIPKYGANGIVVEVALHVLKIQNFDKTIVTLPTYKLIEDGFKNWRGMVESGARRIMRSTPIDQGTIKFLHSDEIKHILNTLAPSQFHITLDSETIKALNTNLGMFRSYMENYLQQHPKIRQDLPVIVRLLEPTHVGLPLQISVYCIETQWLEYEKVQCEIFEHLTAMIPMFQLRIFQSPTGADLSNIFNEDLAKLFNQLRSR